MQLQLITSLKRVNLRVFSSYKSKTREGFGSFHSKDIEVLIRQSIEEYEVPTAYYDIQEKLHSLGLHPSQLLHGHNSGTILYGKSMKETNFYIDSSWCFLNHGAFGGSLKFAVKESNLWRELSECQPLKYFDRILLPMIAHSTREMSKYLNCPVDELVPIQNVTFGLNSLLNSIDFDSNDEIIYFSLTYGSTKKMVQDICRRKNLKYKVIQLPLPIHSKFDILSKISNEVTNITKLIIIDQITSNTGASLPVKEISLACKINSPSCYIAVDAAHSLLSQDVRIYSNKLCDSLNDGNTDNKTGNYAFRKEFDEVSCFSYSDNTVADINGRTSDSTSRHSIDIWITNCHKWFSNSKGSVCFYIFVKSSI